MDFRKRNFSSTLLLYRWKNQKGLAACPQLPETFVLRPYLQNDTSGPKWIQTMVQLEPGPDLGVLPTIPHRIQKGKRRIKPGQGSRSSGGHKSIQVIFRFLVIPPIVDMFNLRSMTMSHIVGVKMSAPNGTSGAQTAVPNAIMWTGVRRAAQEFLELLKSPDSKALGGDSDTRDLGWDSEICVLYNESTWCRVMFRTFETPFHTALLLKDPSFKFSVRFPHRGPAGKDVRQPEEVSVFELWPACLFLVNGAPCDSHLVHVMMMMMMMMTTTTTRTATTAITMEKVY